jgi:hypothetical protein
MAYIPETYSALHKTKQFSGLLVILTLCLAPLVRAQDRDRDRDRDRDSDADRDRVVRLEPGTMIPVRTNESIDVDKGDSRVYAGTVDQDVFGNNGRLVVPRGSVVEMMIRYAPDNDLTLDLESVVVSGQRYGIRTEQKRIESRRDDSLIGTIVGAINGGEARGRAVRVPRDSVVTFRLARPLDLGVEDRGVTRDGRHYHDDHDHDSEDRSR